MKRTGAVIVGERDILQAGFVATLDKSRFRVARDLSYENALTWRRQEPKVNRLYLIIESPERPQAAKDVVGTIRQDEPEACIVLVTTCPNEAGWAFDSGVDGCLPHTISAHALVAALELLVCKEVVVGMAFPIAKRVTEVPPPQAISMAIEASNSPLSVREREVLACVARGDSNKRIARALKICEATVKGHVRTVLRKIGASNRTQAAVMANEMLTPLMISSPVNGHC